MKKILLNFLPSFIVKSYRSLKLKIINYVDRNSIKGSKIEYVRLYNQSLNKKHPVVDEFINNKQKDDKFINELAFTTQISIKNSPPNFQHGRIIYALLGEYLKKVRDENFAHTLLDIGTARGFSSIIMSRFMINNSIKGNIHSIDIIKHNKKKYWNSILDVEKGKLSRKQILEPYQEYLKNIYFHEGQTNNILSNLKLDRINFAFVDGSHEYKDVAFEYNYIKQRQKKGDLILFDDVTEKYKGIIELVDEIKVSSQYNVRIIESSKYRAYAIAERLS